LWADPNARAQFPRSALADLYDPLAMPPALDRAVDKCYRPAEFPSDRARVEYLYQLYEQLTAPLAPSATAKPKRTRKAKTKREGARIIESPEGTPE